MPERRGCRLADTDRRRVRRLADRHRHDGHASGLQPVGFGQDVHGVERLDFPPARKRNDHLTSSNCLFSVNSGRKQRRLALELP